MVHACSVLEFEVLIDLILLASCPANGIVSDTIASLRLSVLRLLEPLRLSPRPSYYWHVNFINGEIKKSSTEYLLTGSAADSISVHKLIFSRKQYDAIVSYYYTLCLLV